MAVAAAADGEVAAVVVS
ncbi:hypothetical protein EE612_050058 [Oryza sativa]|nr:hypothetical protein EE612_050058 [Oryza sativa]